MTKQVETTVEPVLVTEQEIALVNGAGEIASKYLAVRAEDTKTGSQY